MKWIKILIPVGILIIGFILMKILLSFEEEPQSKPTLAREKIVKTEIVELKDIQSEVVALGRLSSAQPVELFSEVTGIAEPGDVPFRPGQPFRKGNLLLKIDDRQINFDLNSTKSDLLTALASVLPEIKVDFPDEFQTWQNYFNNCNFKSELAKLPEVTNQKIKLYLARFNVYKLYYQVKNLEIRSSKHKIFAPFSGSIVSTDLRVGSTARAGARLGNIINLDNMEVEVPIQAEDVKWIDRSKNVRFISNEVSGEWSGTISRIGKTLDERTQTLSVFMNINEKMGDALFNGVFLKAFIPGRIIKNAYSLPRKALYEEKFIYLINEGKLVYREVGVERKETDTVIINSGIKNGETIVVEVLLGVAPGMPAKSRELLSSSEEL